MTPCACGHPAVDHYEGNGEMLDIGCIYCVCVEYTLPTVPLLCTICNFHPVAIKLAPGKELCDRCAKLAVDALYATPTAIVTIMERRGMLDTFSLDDFRNNDRGQGVESPVIVMEYETENGSLAYCGFASLVPGCRTVQKSLATAYQMCAIVAEAVDLRKS